MSESKRIKRLRNGRKAEDSEIPDRSKIKYNVPRAEDLEVDPDFSEPTELPCVLTDTIAYPHTLASLSIEDAEAIKTIEFSLATHRLLVLTPDIKQISMDEVKTHGLKAALNFPVVPFMGSDYVTRISTLVRIVKTLRVENALKVLVRGIARVEVCATSEDNHAPWLMLFKTIREEKETKKLQSPKIVAAARVLESLLDEYVTLSPNFSDEVKKAATQGQNVLRLTDIVADALPLSFYEKVITLVHTDINKRLKALISFIQHEVQILRVANDIQRKTTQTLSDYQREHYLREQLATIRHELNEDSLENADIEKFKERMDEYGTMLPQTVIDIILKEFERMSNVNPAMPDYYTCYNYVDWLLSLPWGRRRTGTLDIREAARMLDAEHYGLDEVKERILETLAVLQLRGREGRAPILCLVGPPGVGKTSLGKSIAHAMKRDFVRVSLGGISDEAEIRGFRRTYIGAMPGRIIAGMKRANSANPVFLLDEIDKIQPSNHGDPAAALLEVLDPEQNNTFSDNYIDTDYDLSNVFFICTANAQEYIPDALVDRLEVITLSGYTVLEKLAIAKRFLFSRQCVEQGLDPKRVTISDEAINEVISYYTCEAGVRTLERTLASLLRKCARKLIDQGEEKSAYTIHIEREDIAKLLGVRKYLIDNANKVSEVGVATGMAWTMVGGDILNIETLLLPGKGELKLTGSLGEVMKESAQAAYSYTKSRAASLNIDPALFDKHDIHIHVPDGATPKDGPSAGITLTVALVSLLTGRPVRHTYAMTGEINLRGKVTPVGGIKEKCIAALRAGIHDIILPLENVKDLEKIPEEIRKDVHFHPISCVDEALEMLLEEKKEPAK